MPASKLAGFWSVVRRGIAWLPRIAGICAILFVILTVVTSYRYGVSFAASAKSLLRQGYLGLVSTGVEIYDPCNARFARLAPDGDDALGPDYVRMETLLAPGQAMTIAGGNRIAADEIHNERIVRGSYEFRYQPFDEPRLQELNRKYHLSEIMASAPSEFEGMVRLRGWCRSQFRRADCQPKQPDYDTLEILDRDLHSGEPCDFDKHYEPCTLYPFIYIQALLSVGQQGRAISTAHGWAEVWSNQYRKWVVMDAELDHHFEKAGVPQSALELCEENARPTSEVRLVRGPLRAGCENPTMAHLHCDHLTAAETLPWFDHNLSLVSLRNDWLTNHYFPGHPARSDENSLTFINPHLKVPVAFERRTRPTTSNKDDFNWTLNQTEIFAKPADGQTLPLAFRTVTPNFAHYEVIVDGVPRDPTHTPQFDWPLHHGLNTLSVRSVNQFGIRGIESFIRVSKSADSQPAPAPMTHAGPGRTNAISHQN